MIAHANKIQTLKFANICVNFNIPGQVVKLTFVYTFTMCRVLPVVSCCCWCAIYRYLLLTLYIFLRRQLRPIAYITLTLMAFYNSNIMIDSCSLAFLWRLSILCFQALWWWNWNAVGNALWHTKQHPCGRNIKYNDSWVQNWSLKCWERMELRVVSR